MNTFPLGLFNVSNVIDGNSSVVSVSGNPVTHLQMNNLLLADINDTGAGQTWAEQVTNLHSFCVADFNYYNPVDGSQEVVRTAVSNCGIGAHPAIAAVPEPSTLTLTGLCIACTILRGRFRKRN